MLTSASAVIVSMPSGWRASRIKMELLIRSGDVENISRLSRSTLFAPALVRELIISGGDDEVVYENNQRQV